MICPICNEGKLIPCNNPAYWLKLPVYECTECGDQLSVVETYFEDGTSVSTYDPEQGYPV